MQLQNGVCNSFFRHFPILPPHSLAFTLSIPVFRNGFNSRLDNLPLVIFFWSSNMDDTLVPNMLSLIRQLIWQVSLVMFVLVELSCMLFVQKESTLTSSTEAVVLTVRSVCKNICVDNSRPALVSLALGRTISFCHKDYIACRHFSH